jgi:hypothetical protein
VVRALPAASSVEFSVLDADVERSFDRLLDRTAA